MLTLFGSLRWYKKLWFILTTSIGSGVLLLCCCGAGGWTWKKSKDRQEAAERANQRIEDQARMLVSPLL
jgi:hypothetical protein